MALYTFLKHCLIWALYTPYEVYVITSISYEQKL